jgi:tetratricopeptide (TPR) repeat protein
MPLLAELESHVAADNAEPLAARIRTVEASFAGDELVETTLAEAELDAGHADAAEAASDRALKANSRDTDALVLKGRAIALRASKAGGAARHALFDQAQKTFIAANKIDPEDPDPLYEFYKAFVEEGITPTPNAIAALHYASVLAPQDLGLRLNSALAFLTEGKASDARRELIPVAYYPHGGGASELARKILGRVDAGDVKGALAAAGSEEAK